MKILKPTKRTNAVSIGAKSVIVASGEHAYKISTHPFSSAGEVGSEDREEDGEFLHVYKGTIKDPIFFCTLYGDSIEKSISKLVKTSAMFIALFLVSVILFLLPDNIFPLTKNSNILAWTIDCFLFLSFSTTILCGGLYIVHSLLEDFTKKISVSKSGNVVRAKDRLPYAKNLHFLSDEQIVNLAKIILLIDKNKRKQEEGERLLNSIEADAPFYNDLADELNRLKTEEKSLDIELHNLSMQLESSEDGFYTLEVEEWLTELSMD